jgi:hypothetical protein
MNKNTTMTATPDEIVTRLVEKKAAIKRENLLAPEALLFAKTRGKGGSGGYGGKAGKVGRSPKRDKRDDTRDNKEDNNRKEKDFRKCFHSKPARAHHRQLNEQATRQSSKGCGHCHKVSTETTLTLTTSIEN